MKKLLFITAFIMIISSCTENERAKNWGGSTSIELQKNEVLLEITWKEDNMWVLTTDTLTDTSYFREMSSFGMMEGEIMIKKN